MSKRLVVMLSVMVGFAGLAVAANSDIDYTQATGTGTYANKGYSPKTGGILDKAGNAHNEVDDFWYGTLSPINNGGEVTVSTNDWTAVPSTSTISASRELIWLDSYDSNSSNFLIQITSVTLTVGATSQGLTMKPSDTPWELSLSSSSWVWVKSLGTTPEKLYYKELKHETR